MDKSGNCNRCGGFLIHEGLYEETFCAQCSYRPNGHSAVDIRVVSSTLERNLGAVSNGATPKYRVSQ